MSGVSPVSYNYPPLPQAELEQLLALPGHADRRRSRSGAARSRAIGAALGARGPRRVGACRTELPLPARRCAQAIVRCHIWMWNGDQAQYHWDVQITDYFMGRIGAQDNHINVCPAEEQYRHENYAEQGTVTHGLGKLRREDLRVIGCPHGNCPRKDRASSNPI